MESKNQKDDVYEIQLEQLKEGQKESLNSVDKIMEATIDISVSIGSTMETVERIVNLKVGDLIELDKNVEEALDVMINNKVVARGESMIIDRKLAIRLSNVVSLEDKEM